MEKVAIKNLFNCLNTHKLLFFILVVAAIIRIIFCVGFVGGQPQDDGLFINSARNIVNGYFPVNLQHYKSIGSQYIANPAESFGFRLAFVYPLALCFYLFGEGDFSASLFPLVCSLISLFTVYYLAAWVFKREIGLLAALLYAIYPFDIIHATRVLSDETMAMFLNLGLLMFLIGHENRRSVFMFLSGLFLGFAYLSKLTALPLGMIMLLFVIWNSIKYKTILNTVYYCLGFLLILTLEGLFYYSQTGDFLLHYKIVGSTVLHKYTFENPIKYNLLPFFRVEWADAFYYYFKLLFNLQGFTYYQLSGFGLFYYFVAMGMIAVMAVRRENKAILLLLWLGLLYLYFEFAPLHIFIKDGQIVYRGIYKHLHYLTVFTVSALPFAAYALYIAFQKNKIAGIVLFGVLITSSFFSLNHDYKILRGSQNDCRIATNYLREDKEILYGDYLLLSNIRYYMGRRAKGWEFKDLHNVREPSIIKSGYVILGGGRGIEIVTAALLNIIPSWAKKITITPAMAPAHWNKIAEIKGDKNECRKYDASIFYVKGFES